MKVFTRNNSPYKNLIKYVLYHILTDIYISIEFSLEYLSISAIMLDRDSRLIIKINDKQMFLYNKNISFSYYLFYRKF